MTTGFAPGMTGPIASWPGPTKVLVADRAPAVANALAALIGDDLRLSVIGIATNGGEALDVVQRVPTDVVLLDAALPSAVDICRAILLREHRAQVVVHAATLDVGAWRRFRSAGALRHLEKGIAATDLLDALAAVRP